MTAGSSRSWALALVVVGSCAHPAARRFERLEPPRSKCPAMALFEPGELPRVSIDDVEIAGVPDLAQVREAIHTAPGDTLDADALREDVRRIWGLGIAAQVTVVTAPGPYGNSIEFLIDPARRVRRVIVEGGHLPALSALEGTLFSGRRLKRMVDAATRGLREHGYLRAEIDVEASCSGEVLTLRAHPGRRYRIAQLAVTGSELPADAVPLEHDLGATNVIGGFYNERVLISDLQALIALHESKGWLGIKCSNPEVTLDDAAGTVSVTARMTAGQRYRVGKIVIEGGDPAGRAIVEDELGPWRGRLYEQASLSATLEKLSQRLRVKGSSVRVLGLTSVDGATYDLTITFEEGRS